MTEVPIKSKPAPKKKGKTKIKISDTAMLTFLESHIPEVEDRYEQLEKEAAAIANLDLPMVKEMVVNRITELDEDLESLADKSAELRKNLGLPDPPEEGDEDGEEDDEKESEPQAPKIKVPLKPRA